MKLGKILIYVVVLLALGSYIYFVEIKQRQERETREEQAKKIVQLEKAKIVSITLESKDKGKVVLQKPADMWVLTDPVKAPGDNIVIDGLLQSLVDAMSEKVLSEKDVKWDEYGLDKPEFTVTASTPDKKTTILFGARNPAKTSYYVRVDGDPRLFLVQDTLKNSFDKSPFDLREKTVLALATDDVDALVFSTGGTETEIRKEGADKWIVIRPERFTAKKALMRRFVQNLTAVAATDIIDEPSKDGDPYGLDSPEQTITLGSKKLEQTLLLGKAVPKEGQPGRPAVDSPDRYARIKGRDTVYVLAGRWLKGIKVDPETLRDKSVLDYSPMDVEKVEIELDGKQYLAVQGKDNKWSLEKPEKKEKVEAWPVTAVLWDIRDIEWKSITKPAPTDLAALWLDKPRLVISLHVKGMKEPFVLKAGWPPEPPKAEEKPEPKEPKPAEPAQTPAETPATEGQPPVPGTATPEAAAAPPVPATVNALAEPNDEQGAVFVLDGAFLTRLRADLNRMAGGK